MLTHLASGAAAWNNDAVGALFAATSSTPTSPTPTSPGALDQPSRGSTRTENTAAIAGGVVGGVVLLGLVSGLLYFLLRRRRLRATGVAHRTPTTPAKEMPALSSPQELETVHDFPPSELP
jgi:hypothetical protein